MKPFRFGFYYVGLLFRIACGAHRTIQPIGPFFRWRWWSRRIYARRRYFR